MADMTTAPPTQRALVFRSREQKAKVEIVPIPEPISGACVVKVFYSPVLSYANQIYQGKRPYPLPFPLVGGGMAIGRVAAVGPDATTLKPGQLVITDSFIHGRDNPEALFLLGIHTGDSEASAKLARDSWRDGTWAEHVRIPLENAYPLNEARLLGSPDQGGLGLSMQDLGFLNTPLIPFGGLDDIGLRPGERVIVAPATGAFGSAAVMVALAMGAQVIAAGRNVTTLQELKAKMERVYGGGRVDVVPLTGDAEADGAAFRSFGEVDAFYEISPPMAASANFIPAAIRSLKRGGRVSLMGGIMTDVMFPIRYVMHRNIKVFGKWMYEPDAVRRYLKMVESGALKLGKAGEIQMVGKWPLESWQEAFDAAAAKATVGTYALIANE